MSYEIIEYKDIPIQIVEKIIKEELEKGVPIHEIAKSTFEYIISVEKCRLDNPYEVIEQLRSLGLQDTTIAMILNVRPKTIDELRTLMVFEKEMPEEPTLNRILEILDQVCK